MDKLKGEGDVEVIRRTRVRKACEYCGEPATQRHMYLLQNFRSNPASSAYRRDDCSRCSDHDIFTCDNCRPERPDGMSGCDGRQRLIRDDGTVYPGSVHSFLEWSEERIEPAPETA